MQIPRLPDAEFTVMKTVWQHGGEVTSADVMKDLTGKKDWAVTTVLNLLARLADRSFVSITKSGKTNTYTAQISEEAYLEAESKSFLERVHGNSLKSFIAALYGGKTLAPREIEELKSYIEEKAGDT